MSEGVQLDLFGTIHVDRLGKVRREMDEFVGEADAICLEQPQDPTVGMYLRAGLRAPLFLVGLFLYQLLLFLPLVLVARDVRATEFVAVEQLVDDRPVYRVDDHPVSIVAGAGAVTVLANWVVLLALAVADPPSVGLTVVAIFVAVLPAAIVRRAGFRYPAVLLAVAGLFAGGVAYVLYAPLMTAVVGLVSVVAFMAVVSTTIERRNEEMLDRVVTTASDNGHDRVVLVSGKAHLGGMVEAGQNRGIDIGRVHVSKLFRAGETFDDPTLSDLPRVGGGSDRSEAVPDDRLAPLGPRVGAYLLDISLILVTLVVAGAGLQSLYVLAGSQSTLAAPLVVFLLLVPFLYRTLTEGLLGFTPGKRLFALEVIEWDGSPVSLRIAAVRNLYRTFDLLVLYLPALLDDRNRLLADRLAGTYVVHSDR